MKATWAQIVVGSLAGMLSAGIVFALMGAGWSWPAAFGAMVALSGLAGLIVGLAGRWLTTRRDPVGPEDGV